MSRQTKELIYSDVSGVLLRQRYEEPVKGVEPNTVVSLSLPFGSKRDAAGSTEEVYIDLDLSPKEAVRLIYILTENMTKVRIVETLNTAFSIKWQHAPGAIDEMRQYDKDRVSAKKTA